MSAAKRTTGKAEDTKVEGAKAESPAPKNEAPKAQDPKAPSTESESPVADDAAAKATPKGGKSPQDKVKDFSESPNPTSEDWEDPHVNIANLPANHDPVVVSDHEQASRAAEVKQSRLTAKTAVQVSQLDTSQFGGNVLDSLSHKAGDEDKGSSKN